MDKKDLVEINGKLYNTLTGEVLPGSVKPSVPAKIHTHSNPANKKPAAHLGHKNINHAKPHTQSPSHLLMRQAVQRPGPSLKRQIKVSGALDLRQNTLSTSDSLSSSHQLLSSHQASTIKEVKHFSEKQLTHSYHEASNTQQPRYSSANKPVTRNVVTTLPKRPQTTEQILERAINKADAHEQPLLPKPPRTHTKRLRFFSKPRTA